MRIAVISDTHGLLRQQVVDELHQCDLILHAGDVGKASLLKELASIATLKVVRGNIDLQLELPATELVEAAGKYFYLLHNLEELDIDPKAAGVHVVIHGHTHQASLVEQNDTLYLNPGSIGPKRFNYDCSMTFIRIENDELIIEPRSFDVD